MSASCLESIFPARNLLIVPLDDEPGPLGKVDESQPADRLSPDETTIGPCPGQGHGLLTTVCEPSLRRNLRCQSREAAPAERCATNVPRTPSWPPTAIAVTASTPPARRWRP